MKKQGGTRRGFLKAAALAGGLGAPAPAAQTGAAADKRESSAAQGKQPLEYPRVFRGRQLAMVAFPLGGVAAGSISLGGRGQLRDWEIFNRPDKGRSPNYAFPAIWVQSGNGKPLARVLEASLLPPYSTPQIVGAENAPGLVRLDTASFSGEFPIATVAFEDPRLPVKVTLEAFSPFIPHDTEDSGLPVAVLRYKVRNPGKEKAVVSIAWAIENPVDGGQRDTAGKWSAARENVHQSGNGLEGILMRNPGMEKSDPENGTFALCLLGAADGKVSHLRGWPKAKWWSSPLLYWDDFSADGEVGPEAHDLKPVGVTCLKREIAPGSGAEYTFLLAWHFPNRTPEWSGWTAPKGDEKTIIGNYYCTRFADAWAAAEYAAGKLQDLEKRTRQFVAVMRQSTLPAQVKDAAMANVSTLVTQTCFRTADGEFHGFEGCDDHLGCCFGNCTHVWNYESTTQHLFPSFGLSLRKSAFGFSEDTDGGMRHRQILPDGKERYGYAAADGQMGQIIKAYLDWRLSGDIAWLRAIWPNVKRGIEFAWIPGGWDADRDGVMEGVQHNTYDVEFYGPNPQCGIYYLGALRACEEMARAVEDSQAAAEYHRLFLNGSQWMDSNLFNGEYYIQKVRSIPANKIAKALVSTMGSDSGENPEFQVGDGCLVDQLIGQYAADIAGLGDLLDAAKIRKTLESIYKYNFKPTLRNHDSVQRVYALNDEAALVICDYGRGERPKSPFPYYAEAWTGIEYAIAAQMIQHGLTRQGMEIIEAARRRHDGERRNPWDEPECGHHYARAMSAWSPVLAISAFSYNGARKRVEAHPRMRAEKFSSIWSAGTGWGSFSQTLANGRLTFALSVHGGSLACRSVSITGKSSGDSASVTVRGSQIAHQLERNTKESAITFKDDLALGRGDTLSITI
jgi:uncharacterized protein (DUF608 family)